MMKHLVLALFLVTYVTASEVAAPHPQEEDSGRLFFSNNGNLMLQTNTTAILAAVALLFVVGIVIAAFFFLADDTFRSGHESGYTNYENTGNYAGYDQEQYYRTKRSSVYESDLAFQMDQLDAAFKAYNVDDEDCQKYVACEASQLERLEENGELAKEVLSIMTNLKSRKNAVPSLKRPFLNELLDTFIAGEFAREQEVKDACGKLRYRCTAIKKPY